MEDVTRYHPSPDQLAVAEAVEDSLADLMPLARVHAKAEESADVWSSLEGLGVFAIGVSEEKGGSALYQLGNQASKVLDNTSWLDPICEAGDLGKPVAQLDAKQALRLRLID